MHIRFYPQNRNQRVLADIKSAPIRYVLGEKDHKKVQRIARPQVLLGDPELTAAVIESSLHRNAFASGSLNFEEPFASVSTPLLLRICRLFDEQLCPDSPGECACLWVLHQRDCGFELHFIASTDHLITGTQITPYLHHIDRSRFTLFTDYINAACGFSSPRNPNKTRGIRIPGRLIHSEKAGMYQNLHQLVQRGIEQGVVSCRSDVEALLEQRGYPVVRRTNRSLTVLADNAKRMLVGDYYNHSFTSIRALNRRHSKREQAFRHIQSNPEKIRTRLIHLTRKKADQLRLRRSQNRTSAPIFSTPLLIESLHLSSYVERIHTQRIRHTPSASDRATNSRLSSEPPLASGEDCRNRNPAQHLGAGDKQTQRGINNTRAGGSTAHYLAATQRAIDGMDALPVRASDALACARATRTYIADTQAMGARIVEIAETATAFEVRDDRVQELRNLAEKWNETFGEKSSNRPNVPTPDSVLRRTPEEPQDPDSQGCMQNGKKHAKPSPLSHQGDLDAGPS